MVFFGFYCVRRLLVFLNLLLILLSGVLVSLGIYAKMLSFESNGILSGIIFCGVFLFVISLIGLIGTLKHHQVLLFFYMVMLVLCFIIQFIIACVCLGFVSVNSQYDLLKSGWDKLNSKTKEETQLKYNCCGFNQDDFSNLKLAHTCPESANVPCLEYVKDSVTKALKSAGIVALLFSFINLFGVWLAIRFRNQRDPKCNPNAFL